MVTLQGNTVHLQTSGARREWRRTAMALKLHGGGGDCSEDDVATSALVFRMSDSDLLMVQVVPPGIRTVH